MRETQQMVISCSNVATCAQISPAGLNRRHLQFLQQPGPWNANPDSIAKGCRSVSPVDGGREGPGVSEEGVTHRGLCVTALKQVQCETKEEIEGEALLWPSANTAAV